MSENKTIFTDRKYKGAKKFIKFLENREIPESERTEQNLINKEKVTAKLHTLIDALKDIADANDGDVPATSYAKLIDSIKATEPYLIEGAGLNPKHTISGTYKDVLVILEG